MYQVGYQDGHHRIGIRFELTQAQMLESQSDRRVPIGNKALECALGRFWRCVADRQRIETTASGKLSVREARAAG